MMKYNAARIVLSLVLAVAVTPVSAQNLIPGTDWTGGYVGVSGSGIWSDLEQTSDNSDLIWSAQVGYGVRFSNFYVGAEWDASWGGIDSTNALSSLYSSKLTAEWSTSARVRLGYTFGILMPYVTAGFAWSRQTSVIYSLANPIASDTKIVPSTVLGVGLEAIVLPYVSARIEALHFDHSSHDPKVPDILPRELGSLDHEDVVIRAGMNFRF